MSKGKGGGEMGTGGERKGKGKGREGLEGPPISCWHRAPRMVNPALSCNRFIHIFRRLHTFYSVTTNYGNVYYQ